MAPNKLLDLILADLDAIDIASLPQRSRQLRSGLQSALYKDSGRVHLAAEWGSKTDNVDCLRAAARHGASLTS
jgi:hypothetical protein